MPDEYHMVAGTKWPNCLSCYSEDTTVVPKTGEWTCQECGRQWHSDEIPYAQGDDGEIPDIIESMVRELVEAGKNAEAARNDPRVSFGDEVGGVSR